MDNSPSPPLSPLSPLAWLPWVAALGFALLAGLLGRAWLAGRAQNVMLRDQAAMAAVETRATEQRARAERLLANHRFTSLLGELGDPNGPADLRLTVLVAAVAVDPAPRVVVAWNQRAQRGMLAASGLPAAGRDREYRLWIFGARDRNPTDCGVITADPESGGSLTPFACAPAVEGVSEFVLSLHQRGAAKFADGQMVSRGR
ncbi:MAG: hypothetical protein A3G75_05320 [Verrucomicrobia bacterium RIFCSPLOWO2_12_FULL_64_8]|nr:MAG: hypothetical protein A3G75_05320 [Verrucomicrobia bacterium RIFCSPLOWO2_12_FULL_64_8]